MTRRLALIALFWTSTACGTTAPARTEDARDHLSAPYVVLVSFDGFGWDLLDRFPAPSFERVAREGVRADRMIPVFPTKTFPTHYSIATGMYAEHHGLVGNRFFDPDLGASYSISDRDAVVDPVWYRGEPIWVTAERQGMITATFYFVGSSAPVGGVRPTYWRRFDASVPHEERVDQVLAWLAMEPARRPHLITLYFEDVDEAAHEHGPHAPETAAVVARVDAALGRLLDGLDALDHGRDVYVVLVSDHGMAAVEATDRIDMSLLQGVRLAESGPYASLFVEEGGDERRVAVRETVAEMLPRADVWLREHVPERLHYSADPRIGDVVVLAAPGRQVRSTGGPEGSPYNHGWDNAMPEMGAIFLARGPRIAPGLRIGAFESVHVYPWIAHVLGLRANEGIDGELAVLRGILSE